MYISCGGKGRRLTTDKYVECNRQSENTEAYMLGSNPNRETKGTPDLAKIWSGIHFDKCTVSLKTIK